MNDQHVRQQLVNMLTVQQAHYLFDDVVKDFPKEHYNTYPPNTEYTFWQLLEHLRIAQWDILDYIENPNYQYRPFPAGYWQPRDAKANPDVWNITISSFRTDLQALVDIVNDPNRDLFPSPGTGTVCDPAVTCSPPPVLVRYVTPPSPVPLPRYWYGM